MASKQFLSICQLEEKLLKETDSTGCCIGLVEESTWKFLVHLGEKNLLVLFEKGKGLINDSIQYLYQNLDNEKPKLVSWDNTEYESSTYFGQCLSTRCSILQIRFEFVVDS